VDLPVAAVRHAQKIWSHVDELRIDPAHAALLARNALRVGVADESAWPAIQAILSAVDAEVSSAQRVVQAGAPLIVELASIESAESVFRYDRGSTLIGGTLDRGRKAVCIDYEWHPQRRSRTEVKVSFEVLRDPGDGEWDVITGRRLPYGDRIVFEELSCIFMLCDGEFVVIGTSNSVSNPYLVGSRFLTHVGGGRRHESLLFVTPQAVRSTMEVR